MMRRAFITDASVWKEKRASISVETFPGMILRISLPKSTSNMSKLASICSSRVLPYVTS